MQRTTQTVINFFKEHSDLEGMLISSKANKFYLGSLYSSRGYVLLIKQQKLPIVFVDYRSASEVGSKQFAEKIVLGKEDKPLNIIGQYLEKKGFKKIGFEGEDISYSSFEAFKHQIPYVEWQNINFDHYRQIKTEDEIKKIKKACQIADESYLAILDFIKVGMTEHDVANQLVYEMKKNGAEKEAFDTIVASGIRGALPHGKASEKVIESGDFVTIDFGARYENYCSDMTRTFVMNEVKDQRMADIYQSVLDANLKALSEIKEGQRCENIDSIARNSIIKDGYGQYFTHHLGHSVGIECHESPRFAQMSSDILQKNMIMTNEPGIYIENLGGIRIEDTILVDVDDCIPLTMASKKLTIVRE